MSEDQVNPKHYKVHGSGVEAIDICEHLGFNLGNAVKYIWRAGLKGGEEKRREDLLKVRWYLERATHNGRLIACDQTLYDRIERVRSFEEPSSVLRAVLYGLIMGATGPTYITRGNIQTCLHTLDAAIAHSPLPQA